MAAGSLDSVREGDLLWTPSPEFIASTRMHDYLQWVSRRADGAHDYHSLWRWSVSHPGAFWESIWQYFDVQASSPYSEPLADASMPGADWFPGARLNYAGHALARLRAGTPGLLFAGEAEPLREFDGGELRRQALAFATWLRGQGVQPGDRVAAYLPNIPETIIAMLGATAIGAVWSCVSPDFGAAAAADRLAQLEPTVLLAGDGYPYGGTGFDRTAEANELVASLGDQLRRVVWVPSGFGSRLADAVSWEDAIADDPPADFEFEQVAFDHPLWVLFSSGTTGPPKAIMHGHGGILLEQLKLQGLHMDLHAGDRLFFYSTTGWMMWNFLASSLILGVVPVLYNGHPTFPTVGRLWELAEESGAVFFGASPSYVELLERDGYVPKEHHDLSRVRCIMPAGAPVPPRITAWFLQNVHPDVWVATGSGGTDVCTGLVGGTPLLPVYAGEIQAPHLGVAAHAYDEEGRAVVGELGELVVTVPMPSMPLGFWGDDDGERYRESYFDTYPGVWRHGDLFRVNERGGCFVAGRSDATLNRHGIRIGTAEIYRVVESVEGVESALVVDVTTADSGSFMPLFVQLAPGRELDDALQTTIRRRLRAEASPRHVPDAIIAVDAVPMTRTGKKLEVPVRRLLQGADPAAVAAPGSMADPRALDEYAALRTTLGKES